MLYDYLIDRYDKGEPIFLSEITGYSKDYIRQEMKRLTDEGKLARLSNGIYYIPYITIFGSDGKVSTTKLIEKKFIKIDGNTFGYYSGLSLANMLGFTSQNPAIFEICSNVATTKQRKIDIDGIKMVIYKPVADVTNENYKELQFLELMTILDKYCEISEIEMKKKLLEYTKSTNINFDVVKEYLPLCPSKVYKNIYNGGLMSELV